MARYTWSRWAASLDLATGSGLGRELGALGAHAGQVIAIDLRERR
jgi:hypothetical protein